MGWHFGPDRVDDHAAQTVDRTDRFCDRGVQDTDPPRICGADPEHRVRNAAGVEREPPQTGVAFSAHYYYNRLSAKYAARWLLCR